MKRVQGVNDSLAQVWGRAAPNGLPAENTARSIRSRKTRPRRAADSVSPSLRSPSGSPQRNAQARSELTKPDNCTAFENVLTAIPTHGGTGTQHSASCFSFPDEGKETGVIERKTFRQERMAGVRGAQNATCRETPPSPTATPPFQGRQPTLPQQERRAPPPAPRAHNPLCRSCNRPNATFRRPAIHEPIKRKNASPRQRGRRIDNIPLRLTTLPRGNAAMTRAPSKPNAADRAFIIAAPAAPFNALFNKY